MRIPRIFTEQSLQAGSDIELDENASRHVGKVLRMQAGRELILFDGRGGEYTATITDVGKKVVRVAISEFHDVERESPLAIHLGIGISRGERMDWVLQKATELGVTRITPLFTERTEVKLTGPRLEKKRQHWQQILVSACEQCQRNTLPQLQTAQRFDDWLPDVTETSRFVLHHRTDVSLSATEKPASVALVIGPEGGLSDVEIQRAQQHQFQPLALGPRVFRTETAPIAAISVLQYLWGDLS
ncbi:16S rRNA (uracil(1498)-N(3))-methyltransferase [Aestuariicella sp. G3-2]|uniref:16S rRNA (uracil(1498)-N(3))-methyltransferase n=1 Tax=Pseudomaricurvus albidus TaxID=2842452 RepID=UPI001C0DB855|nr:16S rRNA (uracil(1498)-N(3))-methyltransferase [Aestuariicella albida]MBU3068460.1 16S rRNA (uracil(1498)-N(3))-methyltransferase [Aestuariicella albida]